MGVPAENTRYSFADLLTWEEDGQMELLSGQVVMMAPPLRGHQEVSGELFRQLANFLEGKRCRVYAAPFAVRLFEAEGDAPEDVDTVVEPDITVVCDTGKLDKYGCKGARLVKLELYQRAGVAEYWLVDPENQSVQVLLLGKEGYLLPREDYGRRDIAKVNVLEGCFIELEKVFPEEK